MLERITAPPSRRWATSSVWSGAVWVLLAMLPLPLTTLLGLPFAVYALAAGWLGWRESRRLHDHSGAWRASAGMGLGCFGFVWLLGVYLVIGAALILAAAAGLHTLLIRTPMP